jgi:hypothetical protein
VNDLNPEILDTNPQLFFHLQKAVTLFPHTRRGARDTHTDFRPAPSKCTDRGSCAPLPTRASNMSQFFFSAWSIPRGRRHAAACDTACN